MISERTTEQRIPLYYDLYTPDGEGAQAKPLLIALHGYKGHKESMLALAQKINSRDFLIASVQGPNAFFMSDDENLSRPSIGFGWMVQYKAEQTIRLHHQTLLSIIEEIEAEREIDRRAIFLIGFSQTVSLNYRFAFTHPGLIRGVVAVCGGIPGDWDEEKYQASDTDVLIIAGEIDQYYPLDRTRAFKDALGSRARSVEYKSYAVGHVFPRQSLPFINDWLLERIKNQQA